MYIWYARYQAETLIWCITYLYHIGYELNVSYPVTDRHWIFCLSPMLFPHDVLMCILSNTSFIWYISYQFETLIWCVSYLYHIGYELIVSYLVTDRHWICSLFPMLFPHDVLICILSNTSFIWYNSYQFETLIWCVSYLYQIGYELNVSYPVTDRHWIFCLSPMLFPHDVLMCILSNTSFIWYNSY